jgi:hypothetical protein
MMLLRRGNRKKSAHRTPLIWHIYIYICLYYIIALFGPRRDEVTGEWVKLHNKELHDQYSSPNIVLVIKSNRMRFDENVVCIWEGSGVYSSLVGTPEGRGPLG